MSYNPCKKGTLLIPSGMKNGQEAKHLFAITTDPCAANKHLLLGFTTLDADKAYDPACVVEGGCHPFIQHSSYVLYRMAQIQSADRLAAMVNGWVYSTHQPISDELLAAMMAGAETSRFVPKFIKSYLGF